MQALVPGEGRRCPRSVRPARLGRQRALLGLLRLGHAKAAATGLFSMCSAVETLVSRIPLRLEPI